MTFYDRAGHKMFDTSPFTRAIFKAIRSQTSMEGKHLMKFFFFFFFCGTKRRTSSHDGGVPCCVEFRFFFLILNFYFLLFFFGASSSPRRGRHTGGGRNWKWKSSAEWNHRQRRNASSKVVSAGAEEFPSSVPRISTTLPGDWNRVLPACAETASLIEFRGLSQSFIVSAQVYLVFLLWHYWFDQVQFGCTEFYRVSWVIIGLYCVGTGLPSFTVMALLVTEFYRVSWVTIGICCVDVGLPSFPVWFHQVLMPIFTCYFLSTNIGCSIYSISTGFLRRVRS